MPLQVPDNKIKDCGSGFTHNQKTHGNMCFYMALHYTLLAMKFVIPKEISEFYLLCRSISSDFPDSGVMIDTQYHYKALKDITDYFGIKLHIYTSISVFKRNYFSDTYFFVGNPNNDIVNLMCCINHYMAFTDNFDKIKSPISNREILNLITPVKNKIDTFHDLEVARLLDKELNHPQLSNAKSSQGKDDLKQQIQNVFDKQEVEYMMFAYELQKEEEAIEQRFQNVFDQQEDESMMFAYELQKKEEAIEQQILNDRKIAMQLSS
jgi:hypothetical protein